jgi:hypothetical protein
MYSTDTGVYYAHTRDAGGDLRPLRRHEQPVSLTKICFTMVMIPLLRVVMIPLLRSPSEHRFVHKKSASGLRGIPQAYEETNALLVFITQTFSRGSDGKCTVCHQAEGEHYNHNCQKYCRVSSTSPCPPPHVYSLYCSPIQSYFKTTNLICE